MRKKIMLLILVSMGVLAFLAVAQPAYADCPDGGAGDDDIVCSGGDNGNDTVTTNAADGNISNLFFGEGIDFGGNGTLQGDGNVSDRLFGIFCNGDVSNSGSGTVSGNVGIKGYDSDQNLIVRGQKLTEQIAFISGQRGNRDIFLINADGSHRRQLSNFPGDEEMIEWSPDGKYLTVISRHTGVANLYVIEVDTERWVALTDLPEGSSVHYGNWSPDGTQIAFGITQDGLTQLYLAAPDGSGMRQLTHRIQPSYLVGWSLDGSQLLIQHQPTADSNNELFWLNVASGEFAQVTRTPVPDCQCDTPLLRQGFQISPDGKTGLYHSQDGDLFTVSLSDGQVEQLTPTDPINLAAYAAWSPDAKQIAYNLTIGFNPDNFLPIYALYLMNLSARESQEIITAGPQLGVSPQWSVDGQWLLFSQRLKNDSPDGPEAEVCILHVDTMQIRCLTQNTVFDGYAQWRP